MMKSNFFPNLPSFAFLAGDVVTSGCFLGPLLPFRACLQGGSGCRDWNRFHRYFRALHRTDALFYEKVFFLVSSSARVGKKGTLTTSEHCVCGGVGTRAAFSRVFRRTPRSRNRFGRCRRQKSIGNAIGVSISHPISYLCRFFGGRAVCVDDVKEYRRVLRSLLRAHTHVHGRFSPSFRSSASTVHARRSQDAYTHRARVLTPRARRNAASFHFDQRQSRVRTSRLPRVRDGRRSVARRRTRAGVRAGVAP